MNRYIFLLACTIFFNLESSNPTAFDTSFGNPNGYVDQSLGTTSAASQNRILVQDDGKILSIGTYFTSSNNNEILIARYLPDGTLDGSYGYNGIVQQQIIGSTSAYDAALQSDGKLIIVGTTNISALLFVARFTTDGLLDTSTTNGNVPFVSGVGYVTAAVSTPSATNYNAATGVAIDPITGNIFVDGYSQFNSNSYRQVFVYSYMSNGSPNTIFNGGAVTFPAPSGYTQTTGGAQIAVQSDGSVVVVGAVTATASTANIVWQMFTARYLSTGALDTTSFATPNGYTIFPNSTYSYSIGRGIVLQPNGSIVVSANTGTLSAQQPMVARYLNNGNLDTSFAHGAGYTVTTIPSSTTANAQTVSLEPSGKIISAGYATFTGSINNILLVRYNPDGTLDTTISPTGYMLSTINGASTRLNGNALQSDGKLLVTAQYFATPNWQMATIRYLGGNILQGSTSAISAYGSNANLFQEFLYVDFYAQIITDATAQAATVSAINTILAEYAADYVDQQNFNYGLYLYLLKDQLAVAKADLLASYGDVGINQFFIYLNDRIAKLSTPA